MVVEPASVGASVRPWVRPFTFSNLNISKTTRPIAIKFYGAWKGCTRFWARSDQNSGFHGNR